MPGRSTRVEITLTASSSRKEVVSDGRPASPNLSTAIRAGRRVYLSGMLGVTEANRDDAASQTRETLARMRSALAAAGLTPDDVVESLVYLTDMKTFGAVDDAYRPVFEKHPPARTAVGAGLFAPGGLVEIMCVAVAR